MYYLDLGDGSHIVGTSPEVLVQVEDRRIRVRPLLEPLREPARLNSLPARGSLQCNRCGMVRL